MGKQKKTSKRSTTKDSNDLRSVNSSLMRITRKVEFLRDSLIERPENPLDRLAKIARLDGYYNRLLKQQAILEKKFGI